MPILKEAGVGGLGVSSLVLGELCLVSGPGPILSQPEKPAAGCRHTPTARPTTLS